MDRRLFLKSVAASGMAAATASGLWPAPGWAATRHPIGLQLFTVMALLEQDFDGLLKTVAAIGYQEVETIGSFGRDPHYVRSMLDKHGLSSPSQHLMPGTLYKNFLGFTRKEVTAAQVGDVWATDMALARLRPNVEEAIRWAKVMGQKYVVLQMIWPDQMKSRALVDEFCRALDMAGELCAQAGLTFNFHNHADELKEQNGYVPYDVILQTTNPRTVKLEMDIYWTVLGKRDPVRLLEQNPGRYRQCHVKDSTPAGDFATVGTGIIDFKTIIPAARKAGVEHYYVEYDRADDPMAVTRDAYRYLATLD